MTEDSLSELIQLVLTDRREDAADRLWRYAFARLVSVARKQLHSGVRRVVDEEDLALSAMNSFFRAVETGKASELRDSDEFWKFLFTIVIRKGNHYRRMLGTAKRGAGEIRGESAFTAAEVIDRSRTAPDEQLAEQLFTDCHDLIDSLKQQSLKDVAVAMLEGRTVSETATAMGVSEATIRRKRQTIRVLWQAASGE